MNSAQIGVSLIVYSAAALFEIAGCFAFWAVLRLHRSVWWILPGAISVVLFALLLTRIDVNLAGRAYAAYGGIYIVSSLVWMWWVERQIPDHWDLAGGGLCLVGALIILLGQHSTVN